MEAAPAKVHQVKVSKYDELIPYIKLPNEMSILAAELKHAKVISCADANLS